MQKPYLTSLVGAHVFLIRNNSIFLIRRFNTGFGDGLYSVPAGHVDAGELVIDAAIREAHEEAGVTIEPDDLTFAHLVHIRKSDQGQHDRMQFFYTTDKFQGEPMNAEPHKSDHVGWFSLDALPQNMVSYVAQALFEHTKGNFVSSLDE